MTSRLPLLSVLSYLLYFLPAPASATPPPPELTVLRQQYDKVVAERVTAPHDVALSALNMKYAAGLDRAITDAKAAGKLEDILAIEAEKKRLTDKLPIPATDGDAEPESLTKLRVIYREQSTAITVARDAAQSQLLAPYEAKLKELEAILVKNDRVDEAKEVLAYRQGLTLTASVPPPAALPGNAPEPENPTIAKTSHPKGDDRKAAEWVLSVGGTLSIEGNFKTITSPADLPKGRFSIKTISIDNNRVGIKPFTDGDFQALAGLDGLKSVNLNKLPVSSGIFATLGTCSNLESIANQYNRFGDELWIHLAPLQKLVSISYQYDGLKPTGVGIGQLSKSPIRSLHLGSLPISDEGLAEMAGFSELEHLGLENAKITDAGIKVLAGLKRLKSFHVHNTGITAAGLTALKSCPITNLGIGRTASELAVQAAELAAIFPKLTTLQMPRDCLPTPDDWNAIAASFPKLERISFDSQPFKDEHLQGLEAFPALEELNLHYAKLTDAGVIALSKLKKLDWLHLYEAQITDASLEVLTSMKSLKRVKLPQPGNGITAEGLAKFKKQRPDVKVE